MSARFAPLNWLAAITAIVGLAFSAVPGRADANQSVDVNAESSCLSCHENLYYLYDTGKWFCVAKAPMECVHCHGGDATATTQAAAHQHRTAHPIINGDTTTCQQCHADSCAAHVQQFDRIAGISQNIKLAVSTQPLAAVPQPIAQSSAPGFGPVSVLWSLGGVVILAAALGALWLVRHRRSTDHSR